ncbi:MAG TPA: MMPL family transporter, partial [Nitrospiria bacterium]|nr:MMPL family transporter [Nitrospiria bacterium]
MKHLEDTFGTWVLKHKWIILAAAFLFSILAATGIPRLTFENDLRVFFSEENPQLKELERLENTFTKFDNIFYVVAPENGDVFTRENLAAVKELTKTAWKMPYSSRVDSITNFQHTFAEGDDLIVEPLVEDPESLTSTDLARIKKIATGEPFIVNRLISPSGHATGVNIIVLKPGKTHKEVTEVVRFARDLRGQIEQKYPGIKVYLTGGVMFDNGFGEASQDDLTTLVPAMFAVLVGVLILTLQSFWGVLATLIVIFISALTGMGIAGWLGISLTPASANAPLIILTLAIADSIHI